MARQISGQYEIQSTDTAEEIPIQGINSPAVTIFAPNGNSGPVWIGNDGTDSVDDTTGYRLPSSNEQIVAVGKLLDGAEQAKLFVYGNSGDTVRFIASL